MAWKTYLADTGTGLLSGATTGASIGSLFPGPGTLIGGGIGAFVGGLSGLLGAGEKAEQLDMAEAMARGEIPLEYRNAMAAQLGGYYDQMRNQLGGYLGRSGLANSTIAGRVMADSYAQQGEALANALTHVSQDRMAMGHDLLAQRRARLAQTGAGIVDVVGMLHEIRNRQPQKPTVPDYSRVLPTTQPVMKPRGYGTERGGGLTIIPSVNKPRTLTKPKLGGSTKSYFARMRKNTGAAPHSYPSFSGR